MLALGIDARRLRGTMPRPGPRGPGSDPPSREKGQVAQLVEHLTENQGVAGSSPALPTTDPSHGERA